MFPFFSYVLKSLEAANAAIWHPTPPGDFFFFLFWRYFSFPPKSLRLGPRFPFSPLPYHIMDTSCPRPFSRRSPPSLFSLSWAHLHNLDCFDTPNERVMFASSKNMARRDSPKLFPFFALSGQGTHSGLAPFLLSSFSVPFSSFSESLYVTCGTGKPRNLRTVATVTRFLPKSMKSPNFFTRR